MSDVERVREVTAAILQDVPWNEEMGEISGFGGGYEATCRRLVDQGVRWVREHPGAKPAFKGLKNVFGILAEDNDDANALTNAMTKGNEDVTGAMMHATTMHVLFIARHGTAAYVEMMKKKDEEDQ